VVIRANFNRIYKEKLITNIRDHFKKGEGFYTLHNNLMLILMVFIMKIRTTMNASEKGVKKGKKFHISIQCCGSGMFIPDPGSCFCTHPGSRIQKQQ
jgi:hypothetical protein